MLQALKIKDPSLRWPFLSKLNPQTDCLIVSDIKTKLFAESLLLDKWDFLPGFCVLRAREFYKEALCSLDLNINITSDLFVRELFSEFCSQRKKPGFENLQNSKSFFKFFNIFFSVLSHQEKSDLFAEWFDSRTQPVPWRPWFNLSQEFFSVLKSKAILHESGAKALLSSHLPALHQLPFKKERMFVDLGFSFDLCEKDIFQELSRLMEVHILIPELESELLSEGASNVYQSLEEELPANQISSLDSLCQKKPISQPVATPPGISRIISGQKRLSSKSVSAQRIFKVKSETQLEEIQKAVAQVCKWLKAGASPRDIAIIAPDMEQYWLALRAYCAQEKILVNKSVCARAVDFPAIQYFLSALRAHLGYFSFESLERFYFFKEPKTSFSQFKACYFNVPERKLAQKLLFKSKIRAPDSPLPGRQFCEWALSFWPKSAPDFLFETVSKAFLKLPGEEDLKASAWLRILESDLSALEMEIEAENQKGISCLSFNALRSLTSSYVFVMGLDEESLKAPSFHFLRESDRESILNDLGFPLPFEDPREKENSLLWLLQSSSYKEVYLSFSSYDFKGDIRAPGLLYFLSESLFSAQRADIREQPSWDIRRNHKDIGHILTSSGGAEGKALALKRSFQNKDRAFFHKAEIQLSPHRLRVYRDCPFKYAAEKLFFAQEETLADREAPALFKGLAVHRLFESCLKKYPDLSLDSEDIEQLIAEVLPAKEQLVYEKQRLLIQEELRDLLSSFLGRERADRERFPHLNPRGFEEEISAYWNQDKGELDSSGDYVFNARIDRIDWDTASQSYAIRDYKASSAGIAHISSWIKNDQEDLQLTFYAQALQKGLVKGLPPGDVSALFYSIYRKDFSAKGFAKKAGPLADLMGEGIRGHKHSEDVLSQAISAGNKRTQDLARGIRDGRFSPQPRNKDICKTCLYRTWCRVEAGGKIL